MRSAFYISKLPAIVTLVFVELEFHSSHPKAQNALQSLTQFPSDHFSHHYQDSPIFYVQISDTNKTNLYY